MTTVRGVEHLGRSIKLRRMVSPVGYADAANTLGSYVNIPAGRFKTLPLMIEGTFHTPANEAELLTCNYDQYYRLEDEACAQRRR